MAGAPDIATMATTSTSRHSTTTSSSKFHVDTVSHKRPKKKMSITQTYYLAHTARRKLTKEAARADHDLRLLVGHANLLDTLMLDLADAEQEQERWFNQTVQGAGAVAPATKKSPHEDQPSRRIQWAEALIEEPEEDEEDETGNSNSDALSDLDSDVSDSDDDSDSDYDEEDFIIQTPHPLPLPQSQPAFRRREQSPFALARKPPVYQAEVVETVVTYDDNDDSDDSDSDYDYSEYDGGEDVASLALTRSSSRMSPPALSADSDEESEDDSMPPSPEQPTWDAFSEPGRQQQQQQQKTPARSAVLPLAAGSTDDPAMFHHHGEFYSAAAVAAAAHTDGRHSMIEAF